MKNEYYLSHDGKTAYIKLTQGQVTTIDVEDLEKISEYRWCASWSARRNLFIVMAVDRRHEKPITKYIHRVIMNAPKGFVVDHIDGNTLNNSKSNLRVCTQSKNIMNRVTGKNNKSGKTGVKKYKNKWIATITENGSPKRLGSFNTIEEAIRAREIAEEEIYKEFNTDRDRIIHDRYPINERDYLPVKDFIEGYGEVYKVPLTQGQYAIIDIEDYDNISKYKWHARLSKNNNTYYSSTIINVSGKRCPTQMHRLIMNAPDDMFVDHINGDTLDNRRCNLRICTPQDNSRNSKTPKSNTSGYKGVSWHKQAKKWYAKIGINGKQVHLGFFHTPELAYAAYCKAALELHGAFANFG